jgi:GNAT superfamily N-acetyltransferase
MAEVNEYEIFLEITGGALEIIGGLPSSCLHRFFEGSFILATGVRSADENWAWIKSNDYSRALLIEIISIFKSKSLQFIWPVFPNTNNQMRFDMDELGLLERETMSAMVFDSNLDKAHKINEIKPKFTSTRVLAAEDALLWADVCWKAFSESEEELQLEFVSFAQNAVSNDKLKLVLGYFENEPAGCYMLTRSRGIYISHFTVLPKWRRLGLGSFLMNEIIDYNYMAQNRYLTLLATSSGEKLYNKYGFRNLASITIRSLCERI